MAARYGVRRAADVQGGDDRDPLEGIREAAANLRWLDVFEALSALDRRSGLAAGELELLATAAFLLGRGQECRQARLRAYQLYLHEGEVHRAARCAARIGLEELGAGEVAEAAGCLPVSVSVCSAWATQAAALIEHEPECPERGFVLVPVAYERLAMADDPAGAAEAAEQAVALGRRFGDADVLALALTIEGRALVRSARMSEGMALLDEGVAHVAAGEVSPAVAGIALSAAVDTGDEALEFARWDGWTGALARWCDRQQGMVAFRCRSLVAQAAVERRHGRWDAALELAERSCAPSIAGLDPMAAAAARYEQGEVWRLRGDLHGAGVAYRQAGALGFDPQPGMALLRLAEGDTAAAQGALARALGEAHSRLERARLLPARLEVLLAAGEYAAAADAAGELELIARDHATPALEAAAGQAIAAVALADGDASVALSSARQARRVWRHFDLPYEQAQARALVATCCQLLGDDATAVLELEAACDILAALGAKPALDHARALLGPANRTAYGLTRRELEVLALLASGLTNRAIAERLHVTTRTVDTHVSRILTKLSVPTRAAATAFAYRHGLV
ncbi:MAG: response regulator transcription factor [Actinomycetota bacterium]|nr:response regulator transcription factor [Actinomycetota bacterium]